MLRFTTPDRRRFLAGTAAAAASPRAVRAADRPEVLHVRSHADLTVLDPAYRRTASDHDVFRCLLPALISYKTSTDRWGWVLSRGANPQPPRGIALRRRLLARTYRQLDLDERRALFRM